MPNVLSPRDLASRPDNMDETVLFTQNVVIINVIIGTRMNMKLGSVFYLTLST